MCRFTAAFIWELFFQRFVGRVGTYLVLFAACALAVPMRLLPRGSPFRLSLAMFLEYLKSWLKPRVSNSTIQNLNQAYMGCRCYADLLPAEKVKVIRNYERRARLKEAVRREVRKRRHKTVKLHRLLARMTVIVLSAYLATIGRAFGPTPAPATILTAMPTIMSTTNSPLGSRTVMWDTDSKPVGHDTRASACISDDPSNFVKGTLKPCNRCVKTFGGKITTGISIGTLRWSVVDDKGVKHTWLLPNSYCIPKAGLKLFSPQHWASCVGGKAHSTTDANITSMTWNNGKSTLVIPHDPLNNVATFALAPGYKDFHAFETTIEMKDEEPVPLTDLPVVTDDEYSIASDTDHPDAGTTSPWETDWHYKLRQEETTMAQEGDSQDSQAQGAFPRFYDLTPDDKLTSEQILNTDEEEELKISNPQFELLKVHHQLNHLSFGKIKAMASAGILPKRLQHVDTPACAACLYGKATRRPWRTKPKAKDKDKVRKASRPGQIVSVDMLVSPVPGLVAQMSGWITSKRYNYAMVFVDHYSGYGYVYLQKTQSAAETLEAKKAFEAKARTFGVTIEHYHADNGIFSCKAWKEACTECKQGYSYSGFNAHSQSGVAE